jgi:hypothetical protein
VYKRQVEGGSPPDRERMRETDAPSLSLSGRNAPADLMPT